MAASTPAKKTTRPARPRKAAAAAVEPPVAVDVPDGFDGFDLDNLDKKSVLPKVTDKPFTFLLNGRVFSMMDPRDVDWKSILDGLSNPVMFMRLALDDPDEADAFINTKLAGWKLSALFENWQKHYGIEGIGDLNQLLAGRELPNAG